MIVVDTGPLYATVDAGDAHHEESTKLLRELPEQLVVPLAVIVETAYLVGTRLGAGAESRFLDAMATSEMTIEHLDEGDLRRMSDLVGTYDDLPLGTVDASVVTVAECVGASTVLTTDRRHFSIVRPRHAAAFTLLP